MKTVLASNYYKWSWDLFDELKEYHIANDDMLTDDEIQCEVDFCIETDFDNAIRNLESYFDNYPAMIAYGSVGRWDGNHTGYDVFVTFRECYYEMMKDCVFQEISIEDGVITLRGEHHDGDVCIHVSPMDSETDFEFYNWTMDLDDEREDWEVFNELLKEPILMTEDDIMNVWNW